jgi:signal transduction histidine kinase
MELYYLGLYCVVGFVFGILGGVLSRQRKESLEAKKLQLRHARDLMIQSEKLASMGQMVASIGHEIANPVSAAQNATYIMENNLNELESFSLGLFEGSENDPDAQKVRDEMIQQFGALRSGIAISVQAAEKLKDLSHALRTQSRMETKVTEGVDLNKVVQESIVLVSGRTIQHQLEEVLAELPEIQCMRSRIGQVVTNLLANAADALTERSEELGFDFEGKIVISSQAETHNGTDGVSIVIADNGTGVPETIREKIFEEFFTTKPAGVGTGLGLAMCASIVRDHGGSLQVTDDPALGGARFEVWLPMLATSSDNPQLH